MLKFVHLSDLHLVKEGEMLHGLDPALQLEGCVSEIIRTCSDADFCVVTGDLTHNGEVAAYWRARQQLLRLPMPVHILLGNHDRRCEFRTVFPEIPAPGGFIQSVIHTSAGRMILLDTHEPDSAAGRLCATRLNWLAQQLAESGPDPVCLFLHHPPLDVGFKRMDAIRLKEAEALWDVLVPFRTRLRHLFFGHLHRAISGSWRGLPFSGVRGTSHQIALDFTTEDHAPVSFEAAGFGIVRIDEQNIVVHHADVRPA